MESGWISMSPACSKTSSTTTFLTAPRSVGSLTTTSYCASSFTCSSSGPTVLSIRSAGSSIFTVLSQTKCLSLLSEKSAVFVRESTAFCAFAIYVTVTVSPYFKSMPKSIWYPVFVSLSTGVTASSFVSPLDVSVALKLFSSMTAASSASITSSSFKSSRG